MELHPGTTLIKGFLGASVALGTRSTQDFVADKGRGNIYGVSVIFAGGPFTTTIDTIFTLRVNGMTVIDSANGNSGCLTNTARELYVPIDAPGGSAVQLFLINNSVADPVAPHIILFYA